MAPGGGPPSPYAGGLHRPPRGRTRVKAASTQIPSADAGAALAPAPARAQHLRFPGFEDLLFHAHVPLSRVYARQAPAPWAVCDGEKVFLHFYKRKLQQTSVCSPLLHILRDYQKSDFQRKVPSGSDSGPGDATVLSGKATGPDQVPGAIPTAAYTCGLL